MAQREAGRAIRERPRHALRGVELIHRPLRDAPVGHDVDHRPPIDVRPDGASTPPFRQVVLELRLGDELVQGLELAGAAPRVPDRMSCLGLRHDRATMILPRSAVKTMDLRPRDPV